MEANEYLTSEWLAKRESIIKRDKFTCQNCGIFDPSLGPVYIFNEKEKGYEIHQYDSSFNHYQLTSEANKFAINIHFGDRTWIVMPILQVHHKKYYKGHKVYEYSDDELITLCKKCHWNFHQNNAINVYHSGEIISSLLMNPQDFEYRKSHSFDPWTFVNKEGNQYSLAEVSPRISFFINESDLQKAEEKAASAKIMFEYFFERFFPNYQASPIYP